MNPAAPVDRRSFHTLDGMRGVAAIAVACFHLRPGWFPSAYLAVDLFFVLSGFVLSHAYDRRFAAGLPPREFMVHRLIRLWPLYVLGVGISIAFRLIGPHSGLGTPYSVLLQTMLLPAPSGGTHAPLYSLNLPGWTLFFEISANFAWCLRWNLMHGWRLGAAVGISGLVFILTIVHFGSADVGSFWQTALGGVPRVAFDFFLGVALNRWRPHTTPLVTSGLSILLLVVVTATMLIAVAATSRLIFDLFFVLIAGPIFVIVGSFIEASKKITGIFRTFGFISFPLYSIHWPVILVFDYLTKQMNIKPFFEHVVFISFIIPISFVIGKTYDPWSRRTITNAVSSVVRFNKL